MEAKIGQWVTRTDRGIRYANGATLCQAKGTSSQLRTGAQVQV